MKKKSRIIAAVLLALLLALLLIPVPGYVCEDGGTREYKALTYRIVDWNRICEDGIYARTRVYFPPDCWRSLDDLWEKEAETVPHTVRAAVTDIRDDHIVIATVPPVGQEAKSQLLSFSREKLEPLEIEIGSRIRVTYLGEVAETAPGQIRATAWEMDPDHRPEPFRGAWMDAGPAEQMQEELPGDVVITEIYQDCFFARPVYPMPYTIKFNGTLSDDWCVGDQVKVSCENQRYDEASQRAEADLLTVGPSDLELEPGVCYKPVLYLYPEKQTDVRVNLHLNGPLTCTYPAYQDGWQVTALPDGTLLDAAGKTYSYLYWEGETRTAYDFSKGFCVRGEDTALFLEETLARLGLNRREANEFIVYWLPLMQEHPYNLITFQQSCYTDAARLEIEPKPDTLIRVFMAWKPLREVVELPPQELEAPQRSGFTVVEWGGTMVPPEQP